ncbi:MAG: ABC transporter substrate-binding protein [Candidatus Rokubacteria bacterium]|nr:ABC transporter substrate-binding protein [Candidatus Rokubacteria bacterium]
MRTKIGWLAGILGVLTLAVTVSAQRRDVAFTYLEGQAVTTIDPAKHTDESSLHGVINMYDALVYPKVAEGSMEPGPHVAESWQVTDGGRVYTVQIRRGIKFHDGKELGADDVVFSLHRMLAVKKGFSWLWQGVLTAEQVRATGPYTVQFVLKLPYAPFLGTFTQLFIVNKERVLANKKPGPYGENGDYGEAYLSQNEAGSGPYMLESWDHATTLVMKAFPDYWRGWKPKQITRVTYRTITEEATMRTLLLSGQADMIDQWRTPTTFEQLAKAPGVVVDETPSAQLFHVEMNTQRPPLTDLRVRKAIASAFDYKTAIEQIFKGAVQARGPVPNRVYGHNETVQPYVQDVEQAKRELAAAGIRPGQITLDYFYPSGGEVQRQVGLLLQSNLAAIGIKLNLKEMPWAQIVQAASSAETNPDLAAIYDTLKYPHPDSHTYGMYHPSAWGSYRTISRYKSDEVTRLLDQARATVERDPQLSLYKRTQELVVRDYPSIYVANPMHRIAHRDYVKGYRYVGLLGYDVAFYDFTIEKP